MIALSVDRPSSMNATKDINNMTPLSRQQKTDLTDHRYKILDDRVGLIPFGGRSVSPTHEKKLRFAQPAQPDVIKSDNKDGESHDSEKVLPKPSLRRYQSEPVSKERRSIFQHYWNRESCEPKSDPTPQVHECPPPPPCSIGTCRPPRTQRARSVSIDIPEHLQGTPKRSPLQKHFSIPRDHRPAVGKHFLPIGDMFLELEQILPALPSPLQRYFRDGKKALLGGVYPLNAPRSILRASSYSKLVESESLPLQWGQDNASIESSFKKNLTQTCHKGLLRTEVETDSTTSTSASRSRSVHFDPRVTVTEYADDVERKWFSDVELERFKCQTIALAQKYLMTEPGMMEVYSKSRLDPVTGTLRKKALFSLPVLSSTDDTELPKLVHQTCVERRDLVEREVKNILIVDPNTVVLDLFRRSLHTIFPKANISVAENGEEALRMVQAAMPCRSRGTERGFDIVIAEEMLSRNRSDVKSNMQSGKSDSNLDELTRACQVVKHDSLSSLSQSFSCSGMSGSELFGKISEIEKTFDGPQPQQQTEAASLVPAPKRALLIGVSVRPDEDGPSLAANGADFVWGKPPPLMNGTLCNQMVSTLVNKRLVTQCSK
jgi:CheY-like chemotaxis protein